MAMSRQRSFPFGSMWDDPWHEDFFDFPTPSRMFNQHFGMGLEDDDLLPPIYYRGLQVRPQRHARPPQQTGVSQVTNDDKEFKVQVDVSHFTPEEISIKTAGNRLIVNAKHEEKQDQHGFIQREFTRQYLLPRDVDPNTVKSTMSGTGVLTLKAPKMALEAPQERTIPIEFEKEAKKEETRQEETEKKEEPMEKDS